MIKAKQTFFCAPNLEGYSFHSNKAAILYWTSEYYSLSVLLAKLFFLNRSMDQKLWSFKCTMLKTLNSNFSQVRRHLNWFGSSFVYRVDNSVFRIDLSLTLNIPNPPCSSPFVASLFEGQ